MLLRDKQFIFCFSLRQQSINGFEGGYVVGFLQILRQCHTAPLASSAIRQVIFQLEEVKGRQTQCIQCSGLIFLL